MIKIKSKRIIMDVLIMLLAVLMALYCCYSWVSEGMPIWGNEHMPGTRNEISIWLTGVIMSSIIGAMAFLDYSMHKE